MIEKLLDIAPRQETAKRHVGLLSVLSVIQSPIVRNERTSVWAQFMLQADNRDTLIADLKQTNIPTSLHYPVPRRRRPADYMHTVHAIDNMTERVVRLPMHPYLDLSAQERIVSEINISQYST